MWAMRIHVHLEDDLLAELDREVGQRGRSAYIEDIIRADLDRRRRWRLIWEALEGPPIDDEGHVWDPDPAAYFHEERRRETARRDAKLAKSWADGR